MTALGHDWGGLIGLRVVAEMADRFARVVVGNTELPNGTASINPAFVKWREYSPHLTIRGAGHSLQEDKGEEVAQAIIDFCRRAPLP